MSENYYHFRNRVVSRGDAAKDGANHVIYDPKFRDVGFPGISNLQRCWGEWLDAECDRINARGDRVAAIFFAKGKAGLAVDCQTPHTCETKKGAYGVHGEDEPEESK